MPTATMSSLDAAMMKSGSALPMAAVSGTTMANDNAPGGPRRAKKDGFADDDDTPGQGDVPPELPGDLVPIGDAVLPLLLCAAVFCGVIAIRRKRSALNR